ncbi:diacylglycerol/lipid kinase family protein [Salinicoccus hispanicus]|uniref:YegS/Rv2252/BmrU family lipid kinase n=1 Tax=Salinicoccus hispanicus TaxID=157225 RepID=A0A6N8U1K3_9STAP|nr:diacylglycerol kinase family protein [Salinicoccus hispanicus]MXQ52088.1 YegS/Rv2252/BmrU family lipid kinase [Salinicoccus hispanicus]
MKTAAVIINKKSGKKKKPPIEYGVLRNLHSQGYDVKLLYTDGSDAKDLAKEVSDYADLIVSAGGDGTLGEIIDGMVECGSDSTLSILPAGTVNDYARALGLPLDMSEAIDSLSAPQKEIEADVIRFNDRHAAYLIALGDFMESFTKVSSKVKNRFGILAYMYAGLRALFTMKEYRVRIDTAEEKVMEDSILTIVSNTSSVGSFASLLPNARIDDHYLHILNIAPSGPREIVEIIIAALRGTIAEHKNVHYMRTRKLTLDTDRLEVMDVDGDAQPFESMDIELIPACVRINVPESYVE